MAEGVDGLLVQGPGLGRSSVVHQTVEAAEGVQCDGQQALAGIGFLDRQRCGDGATAQGDDLGRDGLGRAGRVGGAGAGVDHDAGAASGQIQSVGSAEAASGAGDDDHLILKGAHASAPSDPVVPLGRGQGRKRGVRAQ